MNSEISIKEIGQRMKAFRLGASLSPEELATNIGASRAQIYRYEAGHPPKIDMLGKIADSLGVSLPTLLGVGVEYISSAVTFFERMRQLEENADQICALFGPIPYLLTTEAYDGILFDVLSESIPRDVPERDLAIGNIDKIISILSQRKTVYHQRRPNIVCLLSKAELDQLLRLGFVGAYNPPGIDVAMRKKVARREIENVVELVREQPIGTQIGIVIDSMPGPSFQIFKRDKSSQIAVSPYRLGTFANIRLGVATISSAPEALTLYGNMTDELWQRCLKGDSAADYIEANILN